MSLAETVSKFEWFHSIDLGGGVVTKGVKSLDVHAKEASAFFDPIAMDGVSVVDIGAWNGVYSFEAKRRGAARVLAADSHAWNDPHFRGREAFDVARAALGMEIEAEVVDVPDLSPDRQGLFDVVLMMGVFYHLEDPLLGLARAAALAKEVMVVETHLDLRDLRRPAMAYYAGDELNGDATNWWGPNPPLMVALLRRLGFARVDVTSVDPTRGVFHAWRRDRLRRGDPPAERLIPPPTTTPREKVRRGWRLLREGLGLRKPD
jgi:tRNA (mo5U34)-methyltransferase